MDTSREERLCTCVHSSGGEGRGGEGGEGRGGKGGCCSTYIFHELDIG